MKPGFAFFKALSLTALGAALSLSGCVWTTTSYKVTSGPEGTTAEYSINGETFFKQAKICGTVYRNGELMRHRSAIFKYRYELDGMPEVKVSSVFLDGNGHGCTEIVFSRFVSIGELYPLGKSARALAEIPGGGQGDGRLKEAMPNNIELEFNIEDDNEEDIEKPTGDEDYLDVDAFLLKKSLQTLRGAWFNPRPIAPTVRKELTAPAPEAPAPTRESSRASAAI